MECERKNDQCKNETVFGKKSYSVKVEVEELEDLLGPDDVDVDFRRILEEAKDERGRETYETFSRDGLSEFLVASRSRWDKNKSKWNAPRRQNSLASASEGWWQEGQERQRVGWSSLEKKGYGGSGRLPAKLRPRDSGH